MASALFQLSSDGGSNYLAAGTAMADANVLAYVSSGTYSMKARLASTSGVSAVAWAITSADDAHAASLPTVTTAADKTCTFSVPKTGGAWLLRCTVNGGVNAQGNADASLVRSLAVKVLNANGQQEVAVGEVDEAGTYGWTKAVNDIGRTAGAVITESALRTAAAALTAALNVNGQKITGLGAPSASTDADTKGARDTAITTATSASALATTFTGATALTAADGTETLPVVQSSTLKSGKLSLLRGLAFLFGLGLSTVTYSGGTTLTQASLGSDITVDNSVTVGMAGHIVQASGTLTLGTSAVLHNDGSAGTNNATTAGSGAAAGQFALATVNGATGGASGGANAGSNGTAAAAPALGGNSGKGGNSNGGGAGGSAGTATAPTGSYGQFRLEEGMFNLGGTYQKCRGGAGGGGGGGAVAGSGSGGGGGGGIAVVLARKIVMGTGSRISCNGGAGGNNANTNGGAGGGGGGGFLVVICDEMVLPGGATYADHFKAAGGTGGVASGGGSSGADGSAGRVRVIVGGVLVYALN